MGACGGSAARGSQLRGGANRSCRMARVAGPGGGLCAAVPDLASQPRKALIVQPMGRTEAEQAFYETLGSFGPGTPSTVRAGTQTRQAQTCFDPYCCEGGS